MIERTTTTTTINKDVEARLHWKPFGNVVEAKVEHITGIVFEAPVTGKAHKGADGDHKEAVKCYNCGGNHHTLKCPKPVMSKKAEPSVITGLGAATGAAGAAGGAGGSGAYVVKRISAGRAQHEDDNRKVRVTNLAEDCNGDKLRSLFASQGLIERFFLMTDRETRRCKGVAFISYMKRESALKACMNLDKYGFEHMVISVEMADGTIPGKN